MCCHNEKHGFCREEYYGLRCPVCNCFCAHDNAPWDEPTPEEQRKIDAEYSDELDEFGEEL